MFEILTIAIFIWLLMKAVSFALRLTWGLAKIIASILIGLAFPALVLAVVFAGGVLLLIPIAMVAIAVLILKACL